MLSVVFQILSNLRFAQKHFSLAVLDGQKSIISEATHKMQNSGVEPLMFDIYQRMRYRTESFTYLHRQTSLKIISKCLGKGIKNRSNCF